MQDWEILYMPYETTASETCLHVV